MPSGWQILLTEEEISPIDFEAPVDFVAITGKVSHRQRIEEIATEFRRRGRIVLIGGPFATLDPEYVRPCADILFTGEIEEIAPQLFADLAAGIWKDRYDGGRPDLRLSPVPRWDLYPVHRAQLGALQTTRGCPFDCEFCDVIAYLGRKQRHKSIAQVLAELDALYHCGFRYVFICDDNFTVHRRFARSMLDALTEWNARHAGDPIVFLTQASLDLARDEDLLAGCFAAGLRRIFVGIETINEASLRETGKRQNLLTPTAEAVARITRAGIGIRAGIVIGFDHDGEDIFDRLFEFLQSVPLPDLVVNALSAPIGTRLYERLSVEGRLVESRHRDNEITTNIIPARMSRETLVDGVRELTARLFAPSAYEQRMMKLIADLGGDETVLVRSAGTSGVRAKMMLRIIKQISARGAAEARMVGNVLRAANTRPRTLPNVLACLTNYAYVPRFMDLVARDVAPEAAPSFADVPTRVQAWAPYQPSPRP